MKRLAICLIGGVGAVAPSVSAAESNLNCDQNLIPMPDDAVVINSRDSVVMLNRNVWEQLYARRVNADLSSNHANRLSLMCSYTF